MNCLKMDDIKLGIMDRLVQAGYIQEHQTNYVKWSKGHSDCAWFAKHTIRTTINNEASAIIRSIAGAPNGSVPELQQGKFESWYTDGQNSGDSLLNCQASPDADPSLKS